MNLYPAIDLKDGNCVRLVHGDMDRATVFGDEPGAQARIFADAGCDWIHVVDLNGAFAGEPVNGAAVDDILAAVAQSGRDIKVELGGGIRDLETISMWIEKGIERPILGTVALRDPDLVKEACRLHPGKVAVGIDARDGFVAVEGWAEVSKVSALDLALKFEDCGVAAIIYTDISRDGAMKGPNLDATMELAARLSTPVILSGGVSSMADLEAVKAANGADVARPLDGVIVGRAIYDGRVDPRAAAKLLA